MAALFYCGVPFARRERQQGVATVRVSGTVLAPEVDNLKVVNLYIPKTSQHSVNSSNTGFSLYLDRIVPLTLPINFDIFQIRG